MIKKNGKFCYVMLNLLSSCDSYCSSRLIEISKGHCIIIVKTMVKYAKIYYDIFVQKQMNRILRNGCQMALYFLYV